MSSSKGYSLMLFSVKGTVDNLKIILIINKIYIIN